MYLLLIISSCLLCVLSTPTSCDALYQLDGLASCALHRSYQNYETYGCACSEISPNNPVDDIDRCCQTHNNCYNKLLSSETCKNPETPEYCNYQWSCSSNSQSPIVCYPIPDNNACLQGTCQCDAQLMTCLGQYPYPAFVKKYVHSFNMKPFFVIVLLIFLVLFKVSARRCNISPGNPFGERGREKKNISLNENNNNFTSNMNFTEISPRMCVFPEPQRCRKRRKCWLRGRPVRICQTYG